MKKAVWSGVIAVTGVLFLAGEASAQQTDSKSINVSVGVNARAKLTLSTNAIAFADADPDATPIFTSDDIDVTVKARTTANGNVTLTMIAGGDFTNGTSNIPLSNLTWTAGGTAFLGGTVSKATAQSVGSWTGSGQYDGTNTFSLPNSWSYNVGNYTVSLNYTLTAP